MVPFVALALAGVLLQSAETAQRASCSGRVVEEGSGAAIAGAQVTLFPAAPNMSRLSFRPATATTDSDGRFEFTGIEPGRYRISAHKLGFAGPNGPGSIPPAFDLTTGGRCDGADIALQRGGAIAGRLLDEVGEPIVDARVMAVRKLSTTASASPVTRQGLLVPAGSSASTNDLGEFRVFGLAPGDYYIQATPRRDFAGSESPRATTLLPTFFPGASEPDAATLVSVAAGQTVSDVVFRMLTAAAFEVTGTVVDESGRPVANALVRLMMDRQSLPMMGEPGHARTDQSGRFQIVNVTSGAYTLLAIAPVVTSRPPAGGTARAWGAGSMSFGTVGGTMAGGITTETRDGTTTEYRDETGTRVSVTVGDSSALDLKVVVSRPAR
jgi:hypothetical protein